jgi:hypothetical protein
MGAPHGSEAKLTPNLADSTTQMMPAACGHFCARATFPRAMTNRYFYDIKGDIIF